MSLHLCRQAPLRLLVVAFIIVCFAALTPAADQTATWNNTTGNWSDATRWSTNPLFPNNGNGGFTFDAIINGGTATLDQDITIEALSLGGGTITGPVGNFTLTLNDLFTWSGGTLGGQGTVNATDGITISGINQKILGSAGNTGRTLVNGGTANLSGGALLISSSGGANPGSLFQNNGTFNALDEADISHNNFGGPAGTFVNAGTFNKSGAGTTTTIGTLFTNTGTVNVDQGTLELSGGGTSTGGTISVDAGTALRYTGGTFTMDAASTTTGAGDVTITGGTINFDGAYTVSGVTTVSNGTANFNTPAATLTTLNLSGGTLGGSGSQSITTAFNWTGGTLGGTATTTVNNTATLTMSGTNQKILGNASNTGRTLVNNGVASLSGGALFISSSGGANPGSNFQNNGTFNATDDADINHNNFGGPAGTFTNAGTFNKSGVGTTTTIGTLFTNTGTVNVDQGTLELAGGGSSTGGTISVDAGATLRYTGGTFTMDAASTTTGAGDVTITGGTITFDGAYTISGVTTVSNGTANFNTPAATLTTLNLSGGTLGGSGSQSVTTAFNWTGGTLGGNATTTVANTATLTMGGTNQKILGSASNTGRTLVNNGLTNLSGGALFISSSGGAVPGSVFQNNGTFNATDDADINHNNFGGLAGTFTHAGTFNKSGAGTTTTIGTLFNNTGTVNVDEGTLELSGGGSSTGGMISVDAGAALRFAGGTHTLNNTTTITGAGDVAFSGATVTLEGPYTITGITSVSNGTANFNTPSATLGTLNLSGGTLGGTGSIMVTGSVTWTGGTMGGSGTTSILNDATLTMNGTNQKILGSAGNTGRTLVNNGVANFSGGALFISSSGGASPGSVFENTGTFNALDDADINHNNFGGPAGTFVNAGTFNKSGAGTTTDITTMFTNTGTINVNEGTLNVTGPFTNYDSATDTLTGGTYNISGAFRFNFSDINTNRASITLNGPASQIVDHTGANALADFSLNDTGAFFAILGDRSLTTTAAFVNRGDFQLGGGAFNAASITNEASGEFFGFGTIDRAIMNSGVVRAAGGTLGIGGPISGPGTIQIDPAASLELAGALADSDADFLLHNGTNLDLGADDIRVRDDYNNANFGVGNAFNPRANITGTGQILAESPFTISASGDVLGGVINFGNHRVGDGINLSYQVNHNGTAGASPQLRAAIQTNVNGGNITDPRLSGSGVTASNLAPIAAGAGSGPLVVRFQAASAGPLVGQSVHIEDNFDNVSGLTLGITGAAYNMASASLDPATNFDFGNVHVGDPIAAVPIRITNTAPAGAFSEDLLADNFVFSDDVTLTAGSPSSVQVVAGDTNSSVVMLLDVSEAGLRAGSVSMDLTSTGEVNGVPIPGLLPIEISNPSVGLQAIAYRFAAPTPHTPEPVNFGIVHVGDTPQQPLSLSNTAPADGFSESLDAAIGNPTVSATTNGGSFTGLAPGATNSTSLVVGIDTSSAGAKSGTATITLTSNGAGSSGLGLTSLPSQTVNVQAQVNNFAVADFAKLAGDGTFTMTGANEFTLNLGTAIQGQPALAAELGVINDVLAPADDLAGSFTLNAPDFTLTGFDPFDADDHEAITAGSTRSGLMVELDTSMVGMFSGQITLNPRSINPSPFTMDLAPITLTLRGAIHPVPEPATLTLLIALLAFPTARRR